MPHVSPFIGEVAIVESDMPEHTRHALMALEASKHIHVEKPPANNMADLERLVALARQKKRVMQVGYMLRHHPGF